MPFAEEMSHVFPDIPWLPWAIWAALAVVGGAMAVILWLKKNCRTTPTIDATGTGFFRLVDGRLASACSSASLLHDSFS